MSEKHQLRAFVLFVFLLFVLSLSTASFASITVIPDVPGLHGGGYTPSLGQLQGTQAWPSGSYSPATKSYSGAGTTSIGGKPLSIPVKIPLASTAGGIAINAMRASPWLLAGSLALPWLADKGLQWLDDQGYWGVDDPSLLNPNNTGWDTAAGLPECGSSAGCTLHPVGTLCTNARDVAQYQLGYVSSSDIPPAGWQYVNNCPSKKFHLSPIWSSSKRSPSTVRPATDDDFAGLPDPTDNPGVAAELPGAAYMPHGAPVGKPEYQSGNYPLGSPYKAPDGSTVQPMASVTNNTTNSSTTNNYNNSVTVNTYNVTTHNAAGEPVANPTPEPTDETQEFCEKNPKSLVCVDMGDAPAADELPKKEVPLTFQPVDIGGDATCPAPHSVSAFGQTLSIEYDSICTYASGIKPVVIAIGYLTALFIIFGAPRSAQS